LISFLRIHEQSILNNTWRVKLTQLLAIHIFRLESHEERWSWRD
jgi:hypothetical protein